MDYKEILLDMGYSNIIDNGRELRTKPIYRDSSSNTVLSIRKDTGHFIDFSKQISGSFLELVKISQGFKDYKEAQNYLEDKGSVTRKVIRKPEVKSPKVFPSEYLSKLLPDHSYWIDRGIEKSVLEEFGGGLCKTGSMEGRYVFPILTSKNELIGVSGRDVENRESKPKWKHKGTKAFWKYPLQINYKILKEKKEIILIESIGDGLSLWQAGVKNFIVTFGLDLNTNLVNLFLKLDPKKIYISFNNDSNNNNAGNLAAEKAKKKLCKYFDHNQISIKLPTKKDFGEMSMKEIKEWQINTCQSVK
tara:strand:- start:2133 stop:3044 length:912 start_codon:yes stop_codon:yes gene_type:complete